MRRRLASLDIAGGLYRIADMSGFLSTLVALVGGGIPNLTGPDSAWIAPFIASGDPELTAQPAVNRIPVKFSFGRWTPA